MTIALIGIPHQRPARIDWYRDRDALINAAIDYAAESGRAEPMDFDEAVYALGDDRHGWLLVENASDIVLVRKYQGHQHHKVHAMLDELTGEFGF